MNKNKYFVLLFLISIICILIYIDLILFSDILLCDSIEPIEDFTIENENDNAHSPRILPHFFFRFKRKLSWYIDGKKSGQFSSYEEFKDSWTSKDSIWKIIKDDFVKTRHNVIKEKIERKRIAKLDPYYGKSNAEKSYLQRQAYKAAQERIHKKK